MSATMAPLEFFYVNGIPIMEAAVGQPCTKCSQCKNGYDPHTWRRTCKNCKCSREGHQVVIEHGARARLGFIAYYGKLDARSLGYAFVPAGLTFVHEVYQYYSTLPLDEVPKFGSVGELLRSQRIVKQLPKQDLSLTACKFVEPQYFPSYQEFISDRNQVALDIAIARPTPPNSVCVRCTKPIRSQQISVNAPRLGSSVWHPECFKCSTCDDFLVDLVYCVYEVNVYCERHYADKMKPRCAGCDELIFNLKYLKAMNKNWHAQHFCCWQCDKSLIGQRYVPRDNNPFCIPCYESVFANACEICRKIIGVDSKDLYYNDKHWHEACFLCASCGESLVYKQFACEADKIYCENCYDEKFAPRCDGCHEIFRAGTRKLEYETRQWHEQCFICCVCKVPIGTQSFIPREQEFYCAKCYDEKFVIRCVKCNKIVTSGGMAYKNNPWHRECFTCTHCQKSLTTGPFTCHDEKLYCAECFENLFAKRCATCKKAITGIGGTRFVSFEDRHWHNDCFFCASCRTNLIDRGFIACQEDIMCPECAEHKPT